MKTPRRILAVLVLVFALMAGSVFADIAGPNASTTATSSSWTSSSSAQVSDNVYANTSLDQGQISGNLIFSDFGFNIPSTANITGINVSIERNRETGSGGLSGGTIRDQTVKLIKAGSIVGNNKATATAWTNVDVSEGHGSSSDLWGTTWTPAEINSALFGVTLNVTRAGGSPNVYPQAFIDSVKITIYYALPADITPPIITLSGITPINVTQGSSYVDAGATASDNIDGNITTNLTNTSTVNTATLGNYTVTYFVTDAAGNNATPVVRVVQVVPVPNAAPVVSSVPLQTVAEGTALSAMFATFNDSNAGDTHTATIFWDDNTLSAGIISEAAGSGSVNGSHNYSDNKLYVVTVRVFDGSLNHTNSSLVQVTNVAPVVTNAGVNRSIVNNTVISLDPATFTDAGSGDNHTATINWGDGSAIEVGNVTETAGSGTVQGSHNYTTVGVFTVTVFVKDDDNANSTGTFQVNVSAVIIPDTTPPTITLNGSASVNVSVGTNYSDAGATATDAVDGSLTANITTTGFVNTSSVGTYNITYNVHDAAGNNATPVIRTVQVVDTGAPTITIIGTNPVSLSVGDNYTDAGATAWDNVDGSLNVTTTGAVNTNTAGTYVITYQATDTSNNTATANRTVKVNVVPIVIVIDNGNGQSSVVTIPGNDLSGLDHNLFHELADGLEGFQGPQSSSRSSVADALLEEVLSDNGVPPNAITGAVVGAGEGDNNWYGLIALILGALGAMAFAYRKQ